MYQFNYTGNPNGPIIGEETILINNSIEIKLIDLFICYNITDNSFDLKNNTEPNNELVMLVLSTTNIAHSLGEFTSFLEYYTNNKICSDIGISRIVLDKMPYLYGLIELFIPKNKIMVLDNYKKYSFSKLTMRRNHHFVYLNNWDKVPFENNNISLKFANLQYIKDLFCVNCSPLFLKVAEVYNNYKHLYTLNDSIMIVKTSREKYTVTPNRAIEYPSDDVLKIISENNIKFIEISHFKDIREYICTLYHAKNIIFSYGGPMCTNRFFCSPDANIIVLANLHYKGEYEFNNETKNYWHVRHSMLAPVYSQHFLLDFENHFSVQNIKKVVSLLI